MPIADHDQGALDVLDSSFRLLVTGPSPLTIDGPRWATGCPPGLIPLGELLALLQRSTPYGARDAAVAELLCRARHRGGARTAGLAGVLAPGAPRGRRAGSDYPAGRD